MNGVPKQNLCCDMRATYEVIGRLCPSSLFAHGYIKADISIQNRHYVAAIKLNNVSASMDSFRHWVILSDVFNVFQPGSLLTPLTGGASPSQAGASSPSVLDSSASMSPSQQNVPPGCPNSVLRIIIENMIYPITLDVLHQVWLKFPTITSIDMRKFPYLTHTCLRTKRAYLVIWMLVSLWQGLHIP